MGDLFIDAFGALIAAIGGYIYLKRGQLFIFDRFLRKFMQKNPKFFKKLQELEEKALESAKKMKIKR